MNEEYLYNKTGEDAEIEKLESLLHEFRLKNETAPSLPAKVAVLPTKTQRKTFRYAFAIAASLMIFTIFGVVYFVSVFEKQNSAVITEKNKDENTISVSKTAISDGEIGISNVEKEFSADKIGISNDKITYSSDKIRYSNGKTTFSIDKTKFSEHKIRFSKDKTEYSANKIRLSENKTVYFAKKPAKSAPYNPTDEEKFAYEQLKLALSITSSKLKIVKNKIDNAEENNLATDKKVDTK